MTVFSVFEKTVAGSNVFFATSATHRGSIYFSPFPGSVVSRHGRVSPDLGQPFEHEFTNLQDCLNSM